MLYRIYVGPRYVTDLCSGCWEKFTVDHAAMIVVRGPDQTSDATDPELYHRGCFEDRFDGEVELLSGLLPRTPSTEEVVHHDADICDGGPDCPILEGP